MRRVAASVVFGWLVALSVARGQTCAPAVPSCAGCTDLTGGNRTISSGTFCLRVAVDNLTIDGTAVLCISGAGRINNGNVNGGTIVYNGSSDSSPLNANFNGGTLRVRSGLTLANVSTINSNVTVVVENRAVLRVNNLEINGRLFVEETSGVVVGGSLGINGGASICLGNVGSVSANQITKNDQANAVRTAGGSARGCLQNRSQNVSNFNQPLTSTANVFLCLAGSTRPNNVGQATVRTNCQNCQQALPVTLAAFGLAPTAEGVTLHWRTAREVGHDHFVVERAPDALTFTPISGPVRTPVADQNGQRHYVWTDAPLPTQTHYYRLRQIDTDGTATVSRLLVYVPETTETIVHAYPNPLTDQLTVRLGSAYVGHYVLEVLDAAGRSRARLAGRKTTDVVTTQLTLPALPAGAYVLNVQMGNRFYRLKLAR